MSEIKKLMGDAISEDTATALQEILDTKIGAVQKLNDELQEKHAAAEAELTKLKETFDLLDADYTALIETQNRLVEYHKVEIEDLMEKAESYGHALIAKADEYVEQVKADLTEELTAKAEAYGEHLIEKAEQYAEYAKAEAVQELTEKAEAYGAHLIEKAEAYGAHLIEKAEQYASQQVAETEATCLAESAEQLKEFKAQYLEEFARVDEHARMTAVFNNLKTLIESSGFSIDESNHVDNLTESLRNEKARVRNLERNIRLNEAELKKYKIADIISTISEDVTFADKERIIAAASKTKCGSDEELHEVVKVLVENKAPAQSNKQVLNENDTNTGSSGWTSRLI